MPQRFHRLVRLSLAYLGLAYLALVGVPTAASQTEGAALPRSLDRAQRVFQKHVDVVTSSMRQFYLKRLEQLEERAVEAGQYEQAQALSKEAKRIRTQLGEKAETPPQFIFLAHEAKRQGELSLTANALQTLTNWVSGTSATWKLPAIIPPGGYQVAIAHRHHAGSLACKLSTDVYHVSGRLEAAEERQEALTSLGNLRITPESSQLTLTFEGPDVSEGMQIKHLVLTSHAP